MIPYITSNDGENESVLLFIGGVPHTVDSSHISFNEIMDNITTLTPNEARRLIDVKAAVARKLARLGNVTVDGSVVTYKGEVVHGQLADRMVGMLEEGRDIRAWALFMENLQQNPAKHAVDELFLWLERSGMPITERGNFLAYKKVKDDYTSYHTNKDGSAFRNDIGSLCQMDRNKVDDDRNRTCSSGLHFCSWDYLPSYMGGSGKVVMVEVNPAHVVSIPSDYNNAKGRAEAYLVVGEIPEDQCEHAFKTSFASFESSEYITWNNEEEIDYSSIEDDWYENYDDDDDDDYAWEEDYKMGHNEGYRDATAFRLSDARGTLETILEHSDVIESRFLDGYNDGFSEGFEAFGNGREEKEAAEREELENNQVIIISFVDASSLDISSEDKDSPDKAFSRGKNAGEADEFWSLAMQLVQDNSEYPEEFSEGYAYGYYGS